MNVIEQSVAFVKDFFYQYLTLRDVGQLINCLAPEAVWMSSSTGRVVRGREQIAEMLENEKAEWNDCFSIRKASCEGAALTETLCSVFGELGLEEKSENGCRTVANMRFMANCCVDSGQVLLQQLQMTLYDDILIKDGSMPWPVTRNYYRDIRVQLEEKTEELRRQNDELQMLLQNIPGDVVRVSNDACFTVRKVYNGSVSMLGYSEKEMNDQFNNQYMNLIYSEDRGWVSEQLQKNMSDGQRYEMIYRANCKNGQLIWILEKGQLVIDECGEENFYCVLMDVTDTILAQEALQISEERYRIVSEQSNDIIFEINLADKSLRQSSLFEQKFGYLPDISDLPDSFLKSEIIHPDDMGLADVAYRNLCIGEGRLQSELRIRKNDGTYLWCSIQMTSIFDANHIPIKIIGKIVDIDEQRKEKERLIEKTRRDLLTGLYNKMTTQALIKQHISCSHRTQKHVMMIIDVDNFKSVNDSFGHQIGDMVLHDVSTKLQRLFCGNEIVGRIGGDEFIVLLCDVSDFDVAEQKAWEVCKVFRSLSVANRVAAAISGSVGISCYPRDGLTYTQLFKKADEALYFAKEHGRDRYYVYNPEDIKKKRIK